MQKIQKLLLNNNESQQKQKKMKATKMRRNIHKSSFIRGHNVWSRAGEIQQRYTVYLAQGRTDLIPGTLYGSLKTNCRYAWVESHE